MQVEKQEFLEPNPPNYWYSKIYPKIDWYWYYVNTDWIEQRITDMLDIEYVTNSITTTANLMLDYTNHKIVCDATSNNITITLPTAIWIEWKEFVITRIDSSAFIVTIQPQPTQTIFWSISEVLFQYETLVFASDNINYV